MRARAQVLKRAQALKGPRARPQALKGPRGALKGPGPRPLKGPRGALKGPQANHAMVYPLTLTLQSPLLNGTWPYRYMYITNYVYYI